MSFHPGGHSTTTWTRRFGLVIRRKSTLGHFEGKGKITTIVHLRRLGGQNWVKFVDVVVE